MLLEKEDRVKIGATDRIEGLLSLPKCEGYCRGGGKPTHLRSLSRPGRERVTQFACKSWSCRICSAWLRLKAGRHYGMMILQSVGSLFSKRVEPANWDSEQRALCRKRAEWVRVGTLVIRCEPCEDERDVAHSDTEEAVKRLGHELRAIEAPPVKQGKRFRPIASSSGWKPPKREKKYERLGWATTSEPSAVVDRLKALGIEGARIKTRPASQMRLWDVLFECPTDLRGLVEEALQH